MSGWIPVEEKIPELVESVLIWMPQSPDEKVWVGYRDPEGWQTAEGIACEDEWTVTHWMPLPTGPQAG